MTVVLFKGTIICVCVCGRERTLHTSGFGIKGYTCKNKIRLKTYFEETFSRKHALMLIFFSCDEVVVVVLHVCDLESNFQRF